MSVIETPPPFKAGSSRRHDTPPDDGAFSPVVSAGKDGLVVVDFRIPLLWFAATPGAAEALAGELLEAVRKLKSE